MTLVPNFQTDFKISRLPRDFFTVNTFGRQLDPVKVVEYGPQYIKITNKHFKMLAMYVIYILIHDLTIVYKD